MDLGHTRHPVLYYTIESINFQKKFEIKLDSIEFVHSCAETIK